MKQRFTDMGETSFDTCVPVCKFRPFDPWSLPFNETVEVHLHCWPSRWRRFWFWVFFGWQFRPTNKKEGDSP